MTAAGAAFKIASAGVDGINHDADEQTLPGQRAGGDGMNLPDSGLNPLSFELLDTRRCLAVAPQLNEFENTIFGPDFSCDYECFRPWVESGCLFYSAICGEAVEGRSSILSVASVLLTDDESRERVLRGEINDTLLQPWRGGRGVEPVAYLSSVVSANASHLAAIYTSLAEDIGKFLADRGVKVQRGFCVATGSAGFRHLSKGGFIPINGPRYLDKYDLMTIDATTARAGIWRRVFGVAPDAPMESDTAHVVLSLPVSLGDETRPADAREVERRLTEGKTERYRRLLDW